MPPLADRLAAALAPHLQASASLAGSKASPPPKLTAAAAAVNTSSYSIMRRKVDKGIIETSVAGDKGSSEIVDEVDVKTGLNANTSLAKEGLLEALREVGMGAKALPPKRKGAKGVAGSRRKKDPLAAGLLAASEVCLLVLAVLEH